MLNKIYVKKREKNHNLLQYLEELCFDNAAVSKNII